MVPMFVLYEKCKHVIALVIIERCDCTIVIAKMNFEKQLSTVVGANSLRQLSMST